MEYFGKILCISANDLTHDDRPVEANGELDYSNSRVLNGREPQSLSSDILAPIISAENYKKLKLRGKITVVRAGKGLGNYALIEYNTLPQRFKDKITAKYGSTYDMVFHNYLRGRYVEDSKAKEFYSHFRFENGQLLPFDKINEYTVNASILEVLKKLIEDTNFLRKALQGGKLQWSELASTISFYKAEYKHTLPTSANRLAKKLNDYKKEGYITLISKKFSNQNTRKVNHHLERLILSLDSLPTRPYNKTVADMYNQFIAGELTVYDPKTGEIYDPNDFLDKKGKAIKLSDTTIANYLNTPKNKILRSQLHDSQWTFNNNYRPHHLRETPMFAFSKVSLDDRDLPRKMHDGKRVKAYYAYDVASGCIVGYSHSRLKDKDLFLDCVKNMFRTIDANGWKMPAEVEVEHHLVNNFADGLMQAGVVFPFVRWCNAGNSQEKRAEHLNRAKKYGVEKNEQVGIGRWYSKLEANRVEEQKVYDEYNDTYVTKTYSYDELVADDIHIINLHNNQLHPNQERYPNMTRWQVLQEMQNPTLAEIDKAVLYRYIGERVATSIRRNMYCQVNYKMFRLPTPQHIERLQPRNYEIEACYMPNEQGEVTEVYAYQGATFIGVMPLIDRYNEAKAEQTDADLQAYQEQSAYVAQFDAMVKSQKIDKVAVMGISKPIEVQEDDIIGQVQEYNESDYFLDTAEDDYAMRALQSL